MSFFFSSHLVNDDDYFMLRNFIICLTDSHLKLVGNVPFLLQYICKCRRKTFLDNTTHLDKSEYSVVVSPPVLQSIKDQKR